MNRVTYCPEDNKLRLYVGRVPRDEYEKLRDAGYVSTPKQDCDFAATWTPYREDLAFEYLDDNQDIEDEDYSPEERAADRADRFSDYRDNRASEAGVSADTFEAGPSAFGHQTLARAERQANRHDRHRRYAVSQWSKAEYWQQRTRGVISHALHKSSPTVRRGRILTLESEQRKHLDGIKKSQDQYDGWLMIAGMPDADVQIPIDSDNNVLSTAMNAAHLMAYKLANYHSFRSFDHPSNEEANAKAREIWKHTFSPYELLTKTSFINIPFERLTPKQMAELYISKVANPSDPDTYSQRWSRHYEMRLAYENEMLRNEGGMASAVDMEPGGWIRGIRSHSCGYELPNSEWHQIQAVCRSPKTKRITSVKLRCFTRSMVAETNHIATVATFDISRLGEGCYRPPTDEEREAFLSESAVRKSTVKKPPLVNPTEEDARRLQDVWNRSYRHGKKSSITLMTQDMYSRLSKGDAFSTCGVEANGNGRQARDSTAQRVCQVRMKWTMYGPDSVVVLTDKPQKPLPIDWSTVANPTEAIAEETTTA